MSNEVNRIVAIRSDRFGVISPAAAWFHFKNGESFHARTHSVIAVGIYSDGTETCLKATNAGWSYMSGNACSDIAVPASIREVCQNTLGAR